MCHQPLHLTPRRVALRLLSAFFQARTFSIGAADLGMRPVLLKTWPSGIFLPLWTRRWGSFLWSFTSRAKPEPCCFDATVALSSVTLQNSPSEWWLYKIESECEMIHILLPGLMEQIPISPQVQVHAGVYLCTYSHFKHVIVICLWLAVRKRPNRSGAFLKTGGMEPVQTADCCILRKLLFGSRNSNFLLLSLSLAGSSAAIDKETVGSSNKTAAFWRISVMFLSFTH